MNINNICKYLTFILTILLMGMFCLYQKTNNDLKLTKSNLTLAEQNIISLKKDKEKLLEYNVKKDQEIKKIENKYKNQLNNIPADKCGDVKPSKELLNYLKGLKS